MSDAAPLSIEMDLSETKTGIPVILTGTMTKLKLESIKQRLVEDKGNVTSWEYSLVDPVPTNDGGTLNPGDFGSKVFEDIQLYSKADAKDPDWYKKKIATRIDALLGTGDKGNAKGKPERPALSPATLAQLIGQTLLVKMEERTYEGRVLNQFGPVYFPGDVAA